jgi:hypothetical protein
LAFADNELTSITIGANVKLGADENTPFENGFADFYASQKQAAGAYTYDGTNWSYRGR